MSIDEATKLANQALGVLFTTYPVRTTVGVMFGLFIYFGLEAYPILLELLRASNNNKSKFFFSLLGFIIVNVRTVYEGLTGKVISEEVNNVMILIERSNLSPAQKREKYKEAISKRIQTLDSQKLNEKTKAAEE